MKQSEINSDILDEYTRLNIVPSDYELTIPEIAGLLDVHKSAIEQISERYNWHPSGDRVQGGGDKYNIKSIRFYKTEQKHTAAFETIRNKIIEKKQQEREKKEWERTVKTLLELKQQDRQDNKEPAETLTSDQREILWNITTQKSSRQQEKAFIKVKAVWEYWDNRQVIGMKSGEAYQAAAKKFNVSPVSLNNWVSITNDYPPSDWLAALIHKGKGGNNPTVDFTPEAWDFFKADYLRRGKGKKPPSLASCYRRLEAVAKQNNWTIPIQRTALNWIKRYVDPMVLLFRREGMQAVEKTYPSQKRNKEMFNVLQAVNGDGFELSIYAVFENGIIAKPIVWSWQDIRSSKILVWRMDISENADLIRLTLMDLITNHSLPEYLYIDNTTAAASKQITGGVENRYRWKIKDTDPLGILPLLGIQYKPTLPGHGQSKPVERLQGIGGYVDFGNLPVFEGRGTKSRPVPIAEVEAVFKDFVNEINARPDRRGDAVKGKSFNQVFEELLPETIITRATEKQRKYCLCVAEVVTVSRTDASITLRAGKSDIGSNRYWNEALTAYMGKKVTVRFDPANLHDSVYVETVEGQEICTAKPTATAGFKDTTAAREHARNKGHYKKHIKLAADAEKRMNADTARQLMLSIPEPETPAPKAVRIAGNVPSKARPVDVVNQEETAAAIPEKSALGLFVQAKQAAETSTNRLSSEEIEAAWRRGVAKMQNMKGGI